MLGVAASAPIPSLLEAPRDSNAAFAPGRCLQKGNFTCRLLLCRQQLLMLPRVLQRHGHAWPDDVPMPSPPGIVCAINATYCEEAQRDLFLHPYGAIFAGTSWTVALCLQICGNPARSVRSPLCSGPFFHLWVGKFPQPQSLAALHPPHLLG